MMRIGKAATTLAALAATACTPIRMELQYPNGYTGYLLDKHTVDARNSKDLQLLRAAIVLAMVSRMATATVREGRDADAFADYLAAATKELNYAASDIYPIGADYPCGLAGSATNPPVCKAYYANFESDLPMLEGRIVRVTLAALPDTRAKQFLDDVNKGDVMGAALNAVRTVYQTTVGLDRSAGVYRTGLELIASNFACNTGNFDPATQTTWAAVDCLGLSHDKLTHIPYAPAARSNAAKDREAPLAALMLIAQSSCARLPLTADASLEDQIKRRDTACALIQFAPEYRPVTVVSPAQAAAAIKAASDAAAPVASQPKPASR